MVFQFLKNLEIPAANRANQKLFNLSIHTLQHLFMYHLKDLFLHQVWQVVPVRITKWKGCHIHSSDRYTLGDVPPIGNTSLNRSPIVRFAGLQGVLSILNFCNSEHLYIIRRRRRVGCMIE